jgi:hypothetical protein
MVEGFGNFHFCPDNQKRPLMSKPLLNVDQIELLSEANATLAELGPDVVYGAVMAVVTKAALEMGLQESQVEPFAVAADAIIQGIRDSAN